MKRKQIIITLIIFILGLSIGGTSIHLIHLLGKEESPICQETQKLKESPYTLEEIYEIVEDPVRFEELNNKNQTEFNEVIYHFYDYFNEYTPFKVVLLNEDGTVREIKFIDYSRFMLTAAPFYEADPTAEAICKEYGTKKEDCKMLDYDTLARFFVYGIM